LATDRQTNKKQTDEQMDSTEALSRSCCRERRLKKPRAAFGIWKVKTHWTEHDVMTSEVVCQPIIRENRGFVLDNPIAKAGFVGPWTRSPWLDKGVTLSSWELRRLVACGLLWCRTTHDHLPS